MLIHVEDPGAANWIVPLLPALNARDITACLWAEGAAVDYLAARGILVADCSSPDPAAFSFLLVGTSENLRSRALTLIDHARAHGVPSGAVVDQAANAEHRFRGMGADPLRHLPDWLFVSDRRTADAYVHLGVADKMCVITGNPHHDAVRAAADHLHAEGRHAVRERVFPGLGAATLIVFVGEVGYIVNPESALWEEQNRFRGRGATRFRTAVILEELLAAAKAVRPAARVVLRLHPKNNRADFADYEGELAAVSSGGDPLAVVYSADLVVGMTSALLEDALLLGSRVLSILPRAAEREWLLPLADGRIPAAESPDDLRRQLDALLQSTAPAVSNGAFGTAQERLAAAIEARLRP